MIGECGDSFEKKGGETNQPKRKMVVLLVQTPFEKSMILKLFNFINKLFLNCNLVHCNQDIITKKVMKLRTEMKYHHSKKL